jgi:ABC-type glycerol-3-phosphate transport system substrate-binding protein
LEKTGLLQPQKTIVESTTYQETPFLNVFLDELVKSPYAPTPPGWTQIVAVLDRMRDQVVEGTAVPEALTAASDEIDGILEEAWKSV